MFLIFDTETTGLPKSYSAPITDTDNWPRCVQIAWQLHDALGNLIEHQDYLIAPDGFTIPYDAEKIHGISTELATRDGISMQEVLEKMNVALQKTKFIVGQNVGFDVNVMGCEFHRYGVATELTKMPVLDTCTEVTANLLQLPGGKGGRFKLPTLTELHQYLFGEPFAEAHNATADVEATTRCFLELVKREIFTKEELQVNTDFFDAFQLEQAKPIQPIGLHHINLKEASLQLKKLLQKEKISFSDDQKAENLASLEEVTFVHLHNHSQFSVLQSTISTSQLIKCAVEKQMPAVALTDIGNLMGAFHFVRDVLAHNVGIQKQNSIREEQGEELLPLLKPIVGIELNVCEDHTNKTVKDNGYAMVFLAKNKNGYHNLAKLSSLAYTKGFYYVPRIDKALVEQFKEDVIVLSGSLVGEVSGKLLNVGEHQAEEALQWWKATFGEDFYLEIMRHDQADENHINPILIEWSKKHQVKLVATNNVFYAKKEDAPAHDILLCVKDGEKQATPIGRGRGYRYGLPNQEYYFKSSDEMKALFADVPQAIISTKEITDKIEIFDLSRDVLLPKFDIPKDFEVAEDETDNGKRGENKYLRHLTYEGAKKRYGTITPEIEERIDFELKTIENTGYPGYFLIVQDFIAAARNMGVSVGPGRGSAAGSVVAYCLWITNIDPMQYDLLFERFLNPDRVSMPDIDIDFDDEGRGKVMQYVIDKYGADQVAQIITYGKMAPKSAIRDTARVLDLPLFEADKIAKLIPNMMPGKWNLSRFLSENEDEIKKVVRSDDFEKIKELIQLAQETSLASDTIQQAKVLEGSLRNTGIHACGVIITPDALTNFVPIATAKDSDLYVTQFDNSVVESAGLLKMDFLGLKTLTLIKDTVKLVKYLHGIDLNPDEFPIDDVKTYELFQRGETVGIFQYESVGMQKYLRDLKPTVFADLIAMNALYRPGPLEYIPAFVRRKNGQEPITFDLAECEEYLAETYGITVYQEQVMLLSQKLAGFTKGDADVLRKAMGKKQVDTLAKMKSKFIDQAAEKGLDKEKLEKIWKDWEAFAQYAFNKSHSTCYAWIGYQTAYLKAHYPAEYMAAVLSNNMNDIKQVSFFMEECKRMGLHVLGPDVNESFYKFTVNPQGAIRFGIGAIKGVGQGAVETIVEARKKGKFRSIFDVVKRVDLRAANKKAFENLALAGGFDCFADTHRAQYFHVESDGITFLEKVIKFGAKYQENENSSQVSLFGEASEVQIPEPAVPPCEEWSTMEKLAKEKEVVGIYISGHPLDDFRFEMQYFCNTKLDKFKFLPELINKTSTCAGIVTNVQHRVAQNGKGWATFVLEGFDESFEFRMFGDEYLKFRHYLIPNQFIHLKILVKEGYTNRETGKVSDPKLVFQNILLLQDVMQEFAKRICIQLNVYQIQENLIHQLLQTFKEHPGMVPIEFELVELEKVQKQVVTMAPKVMASDRELEDFEENFTEDAETEMEAVEQWIEEVQVVNNIGMFSKKWKVSLEREFLEKLEKLNIDFKVSSI